MHEPKNIKIIFQKYLEDKCTAQELLIFNEFIEKKENRQVVEQMFKEFAENVQTDRGIDDTPDEQTNRRREKLIRMIASREKVSLQRSRKAAPWYRAAAVLLLLIGVFWFIHSANQSGHTVALAAYVTKSGQKSKVTLTDGTIVYLNAESRLTAPEKFDAKKREVTLEGEAFFEVKHDPNKPFLVKSGELTTAVLGTSFNIRAFPGEEDIEVTVATGKVRVAQTANDASGDSGGNNVTLTPSQQVTYAVNDKKMQRPEMVHVENFISWKDKTLTFNKMAFEKVARTLGRWYGVEIRLENDALSDCLVTGEYTNASLKDILESLKFAFEIDYKYTDKTVVISGKGC